MIHELSIYQQELEDKGLVRTDRSNQAVRIWLLIICEEMQILLLG